MSKKHKKHHKDDEDEYFEEIMREIEEELDEEFYSNSLPAALAGVSIWMFMLVILVAIATS